MEASIIKRPVERIGDYLKSSAWSLVFESLLTILLGVFLVVWPEIVVKVIAYVVGGFLVIKGGYRVINYFVVKGSEDFFNNDLLWGIISVLIGVAVLVMGEDISAIFRVVVGIWLIYEALVRINMAIKLNAAKVNVWKYVLVLALVMLVAGVFVTFYQGAVLILMGWIMVVVGLIGIVGDVMFIQNVNEIVTKVNKAIDGKA